MKTKHCKACGRVKAVTDFAYREGMHDHRAEHCKPCQHREAEEKKAHKRERDRVRQQFRYKTDRARHEAEEAARQENPWAFECVGEIALSQAYEIAHMVLKGYPMPKSHIAKNETFKGVE